MIPYLVINGVSSKSINGLLIQSLPPISKPAMRTAIETVDGRDGDIVTTLGFSAYDKTVKIGLYGDYNVDDVISFFNSSGTVIFSNEADKYYNFAIYEQIDLEKLIRFKTATVTFHVQPFKYSADEAEIVYNYTNATSASITVKNNGNYFSKPTLTITGKGYISVSLGTTQILEIDLSSGAKTIIINVTDMNAYDPSGNYLNRIVTGNYNNLIFAVGINNLNITGNVTQVKIDNYSRWI
jgi:predicted phage tail component-like protein